MNGFGSNGGGSLKVDATKVGGLSPYNPATQYSNVLPDYVEYQTKIWKYVGAAPSPGNAPGAGSAFWTEISAGEFVHRQNTDTGTDKTSWFLGWSITAGATRVLQAIGSALNIDLEIRPKGTGKVKLPTYSSPVGVKQFLQLNDQREVINEVGSVPLYVAAPVTLTSPGLKGQEAYDANYYYNCVEDNVWLRYFLGNRDYLNMIVAVPATLSSAGVEGQTAYDANYRYECVGNNTWYRYPHNREQVELIVAKPVTASSAGSPGQRAYEPGWVYECIAANSWVRYASSTF